MGSTAADAYLASPGVVAVSALNGFISGPGGAAGWSGIVYGYGTVPEQTAGDTLGSTVQQPAPPHTAVGSAAEATSQAALHTEILPGFPSQITGEILFCDAGHLNTDAIYPSRLTYQDAVSRDEMAGACMANYDAEFATVARPGDVLVAGATLAAARRASRRQRRSWRGGSCSWWRRASAVCLPATASTTPHDTRAAPARGAAARPLPVVVLGWGEKTAHAQDRVDTDVGHQAECCGGGGGRGRGHVAGDEAPK